MDIDGALISFLFFVLLFFFSLVDGRKRDVFFFPLSSPFFFPTRLRIWGAPCFGRLILLPPFPFLSVLFFSSPQGRRSSFRAVALVSFLLLSSGPVCTHPLKRVCHPSSTFLLFLILAGEFLAATLFTLSLSFFFFSLSFWVSFFFSFVSG